MRRAAILGLLLTFVLGIQAEEKKPAPGPSGTWTKKEGQMKIEFVDKDTVKFHPHGDKAEIAIVCKFSVDKDGVIKAKISELEGSADLKEKAKNVVPVGLEFKFQWSAKDGKATIDNVEGKDAEGLKSHLEGEYQAKN